MNSISQLISEEVRKVINLLSESPDSEDALWEVLNFLREKVKEVIPGVCPICLSSICQEEFHREEFSEPKL